MKVAEALSLASFRLARFQSPTRQAIAVPQQQAQSSQPVHFKVHIRNAEGEHLMTTIDREVVDGGEPDMKLIESVRQNRRSVHRHGDAQPPLRRMSSNCELRSGQARGDRLKGDFSN